MLEEEQVISFKNIYQKTYNKELEYNQAYEKALSLYQLVEVIIKSS